MRTISIDTVPNQELSITQDGNRWDITLKECEGVMCCTLTLNDVLLLSGQRIVAGSPLIPYRYMQAAGNFWLLTENDELPQYERFGVDQQLVYMSAAEDAAIGATALVPNPIAINYYRLGSLQLDFLKQIYKSGSPGAVPTVKNFTDLVIFTRASIGTYFDSNGVLRTAASGVARFDFDPVTHAARGLMVEASGTNLIAYSNDFTNAVWLPSGLTIFPNSAVSPDGTSNATLLRPTAVSGQFKDIKQNFAGMLADQVYSYTTHVAPGAYTFVQIYGLATQLGTFYWNIDTLLGVETAFVTGTSTIINRKITRLASGWLRLEIAAQVLTSGTGRFGLGVIPLGDSVRGVTWTPDGVSGVYNFGTQMELSMNASSYIPTVAATVTRAGEAVSVPNGSWRSDTGTLSVTAAEGASATLDTSGITLSPAGHMQKLTFLPDLP